MQATAPTSGLRMYDYLLPGQTNHFGLSLQRFPCELTSRSLPQSSKPSVTLRLVQLLAWVLYIHFPQCLPRPPAF